MNLSGMENIMQALGWTLLHSVWQIGLLALLFFLAISFLPQNRPDLRYGVGVLTLVLTAILSFGTFCEVYDKTENAYSTIQQAEVKNNSGIYWIGLTSTTDESSRNAIAPLYHRYHSWVNNHIYWFVGFWLCGILLLSLRMGGAFLYLEKLKKRSVDPLPDYWLFQMQKMADVLLIDHPIQLLASGIAQVPMMIGHLKPVILIPTSMLTGLTHDQLEAVIAHELAHIYRKDYWTNILQSVLEIVFFFHPAIWWISSIIREEREKCCDDIAIKLCGNSIAYANALVKVKEIEIAQGEYAMAFGGQKGGLIHRIERILQPSRERNSNLTSRFVSVTLVMLSLLVLLTTNESHALKYGSTKAIEVMDWAKTKYLTVEALPEPLGAAQETLLSNKRDKPQIEVESSIYKDTIPEDAPVNAIIYETDTDSPDAQPSVNVVTWSDSSLSVAMPSVVSYVLDENFGLDMDSTKNIDLGFYSKGISGFSIDIKNLKSDLDTLINGSRVMVLDIDDNIVSVPYHTSVLIVDSLAQRYSIPNNYDRLIKVAQDSTLRAKMAKLELEMREKELEMEALMAEREQAIKEMIEEQQLQVKAQVEEQQRIVEKVFKDQEILMKDMVEKEELTLEAKREDAEKRSKALNRGLKKLEKLLIKDGLVKSGERYSINICDESIMVNCKKISELQYQEYREVLENEGAYDFGRKSKINITQRAK